MVEPVLLIGGAVAAVAGAVGSIATEASGPGFQSAPGLTQTAQQQWVAKMQLELTKMAADNAPDAAMKQQMYAYLNPASMSKADLARYTNEYSQIEKEMVHAGYSQAEVFAGREMAGLMSPEAAQKQIALSQERIARTLSPHQKNLSADRMAMARNQWIRKKQQDLGVAGAIAGGMEGFENLATQASGQGLAHYLQKARTTLGYRSTMYDANLRQSIENSAIRAGTFSNLMFASGKSVVDIQNQREYDSRMEKFRNDERARNYQWSTPINTSGGWGSDVGNY